MAWYLLTTVASLILVCVSYNAYCLFNNYITARKVGLPIVIGPVTPDNPLWIALQAAFGRIFRHIPFDATSFTRHIRLGWEFHDRYKTHDRLGDAWLLVTPKRNWLFVANPSAVTEILSRGRDFIHAAWQLEQLAVFGPNISVSEGQEWQRQRKLTAAPFNENKNPTVWNESVRQANGIIEHWRYLGPQGTIFTTDDARTLALNVLACAAFQKSYPFQVTGHDLKPDYQKPMNYRDSISIILQNVVIVLVIPQSTLSLSFLPQSWQRIGRAISYFRQYMLDQIHEERQLIKDGQPGSGSLVSNLVRAGQDESTKSEAEAEAGKLKPLTEAEILGNIFTFNFAGHDTTAISLGYALLLLVANREVQDWVHEEIQHYTKAEGTRKNDLDYKTFFPKLKRCQAVLLETLRLYNPLPGIPKYTGQKPVSLTVNSTKYTIPPDTVVIPALQASHTYPRHWGPDSLTWRPQRWIETPSPSSIETETLYQPEKGIFFAWSEGIRNCPGKKFAQVEFVATIATLLRSMVGEPVVREGESVDEARRRVLETVQDSSVELLLMMRNPRGVAVRWVEREG